MGQGYIWALQAYLEHAYPAPVPVHKLCIMHVYMYNISLCVTICCVLKCHVAAMVQTSLTSCTLPNMMSQPCVRYAVWVALYSVGSVD